MRVPNTPPTLPTEDSIKWGLSLQAGQLYSMIECYNYLVGYRSLKVCTSYIHYPIEPGEELAGSLYRTVPSGYTGPFRNMFRVSDRAKYLWVAVVYQARNASHPNPYIGVELKLQSDGSTIDAGYIWPRAFLDVGTVDGNIPGTQLYGNFYLANIIHSGFVIDDNAGAEVTGPRLLNLKDNQGELVELYVDGEDVRIHQITVWEYFEEDQPLEFAP